MTKFTFTILVFAIFIFGSTHLAFGQSAEDKTTIIESRETEEVRLAQLDNLLSYAFQKKERVFVIARLGTGEKSRRLNLARLAKAREYFRIRGITDKQDKILLPVFAEGESIKGEGRVEFYVGSELFLVVLAKRKQKLIFTCEHCP